MVYMRRRTLHLCIIFIFSYHTGHIYHPSVNPSIHPSIYPSVFTSITSNTAQGGGGSFKDWEPIGEVSCPESWMAERTHWWIERWLECPANYLSICLSLCLFIHPSVSLKPVCIGGALKDRKVTTGKNQRKTLSKVHVQTWSQLNIKRGSTRFSALRNWMYSWRAFMEGCSRERCLEGLSCL